MADKQGVARVVHDLRHGGHALPKEVLIDVPNAADRADLSPLESVVDETVVGTPFDYLFEGLAFPEHHLPPVSSGTIVPALRALSSAMIDGDAADGTANNSTIPAVYTYWGQFIDHDITLNTDNDATFSITAEPFVPKAPDDVRGQLRNLREPSLNLDSLYGEGPSKSGGTTSVLYDGIKFALGDVIEGRPNAPVPPAPSSGLAKDRARDLPRRLDLPDPLGPDENPRSALIGDGRNDENLIVAQLHVAFLRFHNAVVDWVRTNEPQSDDADGMKTFARAQQLVRWHYQWLVVNDFLDTITTSGTVPQVLTSTTPLLSPRGGQMYMPLEFSTAAFRFGHSMVRGEYDYNRNFGRQEGQAPFLLRRASFEQLFQFTGRAPAGDAFLGDDRLPDNWPIEWDRFVDKASDLPDRSARMIDTRIAPPLFTMSNEGNGATDPFPVRALLKSLAMRNLLRGYLLAIPTGQAVAGALRVRPLSTAELLSGPNHAVAAALTDGGFLTATPLWFYVLKEAEVREGGNRLGPVGSRIVAETLIGQIRNDPTSFMQPGLNWDPSQGVKDAAGEALETISDLLRFATVL